LSYTLAETLFRKNFVRDDVAHVFKLGDSEPADFLVTSRSDFALVEVKSTTKSFYRFFDSARKRAQFERLKRFADEFKVEVLFWVQTVEKHKRCFYLVPLEELKGRPHATTRDFSIWKVNVVKKSVFGSEKKIEI